jgi:hypothetical protein
VRVEITFAGDAVGAEAATEMVVKALQKLFTQSEETGLSLREVKITSGQATETAVNARRMQDSVAGIGQEARKASRDLEKLKLGAVGSGLFAGILPGGARARTGALTLGGILGASVSGPGGLAAGAGRAALPGLAATGGAAIGVLVASFHGLGKAIEGDRQAFESLDPAAQQFVQTLRSLEPWLEKIQSIARQGLFPGVEQGLRSALSPENAAMLERSTRGIAQALGDVAAEWGKSLGSPAFTQGAGQVLQHSAVWIREMGDAADHLAGALGKVTVAAIPLDDWMVRGIDHGSQLLDNWIAQKQRSGELSGALDKMKGELQIVGKFGEQLGRVVFELVRALTPLGNRILVDLTAALKNVADWIDRNRQGIGDFTTGALNALEQVMKVVLPLAWDLAKVLKAIVDAVGGWKNAFEIIIAGTLAVQVGKLAAAFYDLSKAEAVASTAALGLYGKLALILGAAAAISGYKLGQLLGGGGGGGSTPQAASSRGHFPQDWWMAHPNAWVDEKTGVIQDTKTGKVYFDPGAAANIFTGAKGKATSATAEAARSWKLTNQQLQALWIQAGGKRSLAPTMAAIALAESGGEVGSLNDNAATGDYSAGLWQINYFGGMRSGRTAQFGSPDLLRTSPLANARAAVSLAGGGSGLGNWTTYTSGAYKTYLGAASPFGTPPPFAAGVGGNILPASFRIALAKAQITPTNKDDIAALSSAMTWLRANIATFTGEDAVQAWTELGALGGQLKTAKAALARAGIIHVPKGIGLSQQGAFNFVAAIPGIVDTNIAAAHPEAHFPGGIGLNAKTAFSFTSAISKTISDNIEGALRARTARQSVGASAGSLLTLLGTDPRKALLEGPGTVQAAEQNLADLRAKLGPAIKQIQKDVQSPLVTPAHLAALRAQLGQYKTTITAGIQSVKDAVAAQKQSFHDIWQQFADAANQALDDAAAKWVSPTRAILNQLQQQHDDQALQDALTQAQQNLADALVGKPDDSAILGNIRAVLSRTNLANAIDEVQSAILGGPHVSISGSSLLSQLQDAMTAAVTPDAREVENAQKQVADAQYQIQVAGLERTAQAEEQAHQDEVDALRRHIADLNSQWDAYFTMFKGNISSARDFWIAALNAMGLDSSGVSNLPVGTPEEQASAAAGLPIIDGQQWTPTLEAAQQAVELAQVNALQGGYGPKGAPQLHAAGGIATRAIYRNVIGEAGPEAIIPLNDPRARDFMGGGSIGDVHVYIGGEKIDERVDYRIDRATPRISRGLGKRTSDRGRANRI